MAQGQSSAAPPRLGDAVYARARRMITDGTLPPRTFLRQTQLAREFGVSRTPLREALRRLQAEGLLIPVIDGGYVVVDVGPEQLANAYAVRRVLEGLAAELAARRRGRVHLAVMADTIEEMDAALAREDDVEIERLNIRFHDGLASASANGLLQSTLTNIRDIFDRFRPEAVGNPERRAAAHAEHHALYDALVSQDAERAGTLARSHVDRALAFRIQQAEMQESARHASETTTRNAE